VGEGLDNDVLFARLSGPSLPEDWRAPLVLRSNPSAARHAQAEREAAIHGFVHERGFPVPRVLAVVPPAIQVMERVPGDDMLTLIKRRIWRAGRHLDRLGRLYAELHAVPTAGWPLPTSPTELADRRLSLVRRSGDPELHDALARLEHLLPSLAVDDPVVCHGDLHPLNVLVAGERYSVVDWTDACLGDPHGDLARIVALLDETPLGAPGLAAPVLRVVGPRLSERVLRAYEAAAGSLDRARLARWMPVHVLHDWARTLVTLATPRQSVVKVRDAAVPWLRARFEAALATAQAQRGSGASGSIS
jgi:aminoglycoside phosphotransferase (APT) family kinase protein